MTMSAETAMTVTNTTGVTQGIITNKNRHVDGHGADRVDGEHDRHADDRPSQYRHDGGRHDCERKQEERSPTLVRAKRQRRTGEADRDRDHHRSSRHGESAGTRRYGEPRRPASSATCR